MCSFENRLLVLESIFRLSVFLAVWKVRSSVYLQLYGDAVYQSLYQFVLAYYALLINNWYVCIQLLGLSIFSISIQVVEGFKIYYCLLSVIFIGIQCLYLLGGVQGHLFYIFEFFNSFTIMCAHFSTRVHSKLLIIVY